MKKVARIPTIENPTVRCFSPDVVATGASVIPSGAAVDTSVGVQACSGPFAPTPLLHPFVRQNVVFDLAHETPGISFVISAPFSAPVLAHARLIL